MSLRNKTKLTFYDSLCCFLAKQMNRCLNWLLVAFIFRDLYHFQCFENVRWCDRLRGIVKVIIIIPKYMSTEIIEKVLHFLLYNTGILNGLGHSIFNSLSKFVWSRLLTKNKLNFRKLILNLNVSLMKVRLLTFMSHLIAALL